jgi:hypothetical protein
MKPGGRSGKDTDLAGSGYGKVFKGKARSLRRSLRRVGNLDDFLRGI